MVRKIGFGDGARREKDRAEQSRATDTQPQVGGDAPADRPGKSLLGRVLVSIFLMIWLSGWSLGILFAYTTLSDILRESDGALDPGAAFLVVWLIAAVAAWFVAAYVLIRAISGAALGRRKGSNRSR
ncbi:MAG: hypothetical protein MRY74_05655 [Neomegalonema sp.]|nr:hypothetical protein [Neomegalonema sp.]